MLSHYYREVLTRGTDDFPLSTYFCARKERIITPHWHPEIEILYMINGQMMAYISQEKILLKKGDICFVNPGELHSLDAREHGAEYYATVFFPSLFQYKEKHFLEETFTKPLTQGTLTFPRLIRPDDENYENIASRIQHMTMQKATSKTTIYADLTLLFCEMIEHSWLTNAEDLDSIRYSEAIKTCIQYLEANYRKKITLNEIADMVHLSPNYLCSYFKKYTGMTIFEQLHSIRVKTAEKLLLESNHSIVTIAELCGFENVSFFIRKFKELTGFTPSVYRKNLK